MAASVLAAEFDIGIGSSLSFQYPPDIITHDPAHLAELMLPEGAHLHAQDYTVFVLTHQKYGIDTCTYDYTKKNIKMNVRAFRKDEEWTCLESCVADLNGKELDIYNEDIKMSVTIEGVVFRANSTILHFSRLNPSIGKA